jgi:hypothetical protein
MNLSPASMLLLLLACLADSINAQTWTQISATGPSGRRYHAMAYDSQRGVAVMFGGASGTSGSSFLGDTWEWNGTTWSQRATTGPSSRSGPKMAYDSQRGVTVLFGGRDANSVASADTWEWNGNLWTLRASTGPSARSNHTMAYDSQRGVIVLFGGSIGLAYLGDTW